MKVYAGLTMTTVDMHAWGSLVPRPPTMQVKISIPLTHLKIVRQVKGHSNNFSCVEGEPEDEVSTYQE